MASTIHTTTGYRRTASERRTLGGAIAFVALVALALLAVSNPGLAAATALGGVGGHMAGVQAGRKQA